MDKPRNHRKPWRTIDLLAIKSIVRKEPYPDASALAGVLGRTKSAIAAKLPSIRMSLMMEKGNGDETLRSFFKKEG